MKIEKKMCQDATSQSDATIPLWKLVAVFYFIACGFSWLAWLPLVLGPEGLKVLSTPFSFPVFASVGTLGPFLACFVAHRWEAGNWRAIRFLPRRPLQWSWLVFGPMLILLSRVFVFSALISEGGLAAWHWHIGALAGILGRHLLFATTLRGRVLAQSDLHPRKHHCAKGVHDQHSVGGARQTSGLLRVGFRPERGQIRGERPDAREKRLGGCAVCEGVSLDCGMPAGSHVRTRAAHAIRGRNRGRESRGKRHGQRPNGGHQEGQAAVIRTRRAKLLWDGQFHRQSVLHRQKGLKLWEGWRARLGVASAAKPGLPSLRLRTPRRGEHSRQPLRVFRLHQIPS